jgi:hypothetical protein
MKYGIIRPAWLGAAILIFFFASTAAMGAVFEASYKPWSGYWWPDQYGGLVTGYDYRGHPAPLEKYQLLTTGFPGGDLVSWYKQKYYDPSAPSWWGLCGYWAKAAIYENYEILPSSEDNLIFRVGDKKGLLTVCHNDDEEIKVSGADPRRFHMWLLDYIRDKKKPFAADLGGEDEVWYYPIYKYDMRTSRSGDTESVTVTVFYAYDSVPPDYMGTKVRQDTYTYNLFLNDNGAITGGEWTGASIDEHPGIMRFPLEQNTKCPYIDCGEVRRIARAADDFLETGPGGEVGVDTGGYNLVLLDPDRYRILCSEGDGLLLTVQKIDGSEEPMSVSLLGAGGSVVASKILDNDAEFRFEAASAEPPYTLELTQPDYSDPNIYRLLVDIQKPFSQHIPYLPKNGQWAGFILTNAGEVAAENVALSTFRDDGQPIQTVFGALALEPGEKRKFLFDDLPWRLHEYADTDMLRLTADSPVSAASLYADHHQPMAGFSQGDDAGRRLIIPDVRTGFTRGMSGKIINQGRFDAPVICRTYTSAGELYAEINETVPARGSLVINPGNAPFYNVPPDGWIEIEGTGENQLSGYQRLNDRTGRWDTEDTLFAQPVEGGEKIVPHVTPRKGWWLTYLTLINPASRSNAVTLHLARAGGEAESDMEFVLSPYEKRVINLSDHFGTTGSDSLDRSILEISGQGPVSGHYLYKSPQGGDAASFPLLNASDFKSELVIPHYAGRGGYFWTGACIFNAGSEPVDVYAEPVDDTGSPIGGELVNLPAGGYEVFTIGALFGGLAGEIEFVRFRSQSAGSRIGGFYLYGNTKNGATGTEMLTGANM